MYPSELVKGNVYPLWGTKEKTEVYIGNEIAALTKTHRTTLADLRRKKVLQRAEAPPWAAELHHEEHPKLVSMMLAMGAQCPVVERRLPEGFVPEESTVPRMPSKCCTDPADPNCHWPTAEGHEGSTKASQTDAEEVGTQAD